MAYPLPQPGQGGTNAITTTVNTNYQSLSDSSTGYFIQSGSVFESSGVITVTFPTAFTAVPRLLIHPPSTNGIASTFTIISLTNVGCEVSVTNATSQLWYWTAIGYTGSPPSGNTTRTVSYPNITISNCTSTQRIGEFLLPAGYILSGNFTFQYTTTTQTQASGGIQSGNYEWHITPIGNTTYPGGSEFYFNQVVAPRPYGGQVGPETFTTLATSAPNTTVCVQLWFKFVSYILPYSLSVTNITGTFPVIA